MDYNMKPILRVTTLDTDHLSDADREKYLRKDTAFQPEAYFSLGLLLRGEGRMDEAAEMDRKGATTWDDAVGVSDCVMALVDYDLTHGKTDEALELAKRAGDTASELGLATYSMALERLGRVDEAEKAMQQLVDMYSDAFWIKDFYIRNRDKYPDKYTSALNEAFPDGLVKASLGDFSDPPQSGAEITTSTAQLVAAHLQPGDVVVALDEYRVGSEPQYMLVRALKGDSNMDFIIWRGSKYLEVRSFAPGRRMMVEIHDYKPQK